MLNVLRPALARLLVHESLYEDFLAASQPAFRQMVVGDPWHPATNIGPMIRPEHRARVQGFIDDSLAAGGHKLLEVTEPLPARGWFVNPVLLGDLPAEARAVQQEIFGPVAVILPFKDTDEAIRLANDTPYGLAANIWCGDNLAEGRRVAGQIRAGLPVSQPEFPAHVPPVTVHPVLVPAEQVRTPLSRLRLTLVNTSDRYLLSQAFREHIDGLLEGGADLIVLETFSDLDQLLVAVEEARRAADVPVIASLVKAYASETYFHVAAENIQIHGGIGFTWEHDAHLYFRRARADEQLLGDATVHRERLAVLLGW